MQCFWPSKWDNVPEEKGPKWRPGRPGESWRWPGKHRLDEHGKLVCRYTTPARGGEKGGGPDRCKHCRRPLGAVMTHAQWEDYQRLRGRRRGARLYSTARKGYKPWFVEGKHKRAKGRPLGSQWGGRHEETARGWVCHYQTRLVRRAWVDGGCNECVRKLPDHEERAA